MAQVNNIKILLSDGRYLDYESEDALGIKLNRIVDDYQDPSKRFGEFSYTFSLPKSKNNKMVWGFPDVKGRTKIFVGKQFECEIFNGSDLLLDGIIELDGYDSDSYKCIFFSKFTQLLDDLKSKKLTDMQALDTVVWNYGQSVAKHINGTQRLSEDVEFPFCFYRTFFMSGDSKIYIGSRSTAANQYMSFHYNETVGTTNFKNTNPVYWTQMPPAVYLTSIFRGIIEDAGWSLGGSFLENENVKKIIIPFTGDPDDYLGAITTGTTAYINFNKVLADMDQIEFLRAVINSFNLYFTVDPKAKQISFETYNVLFGSNVAPYSIDDKIDASTVQVDKPDAETKIVFNSDDNSKYTLGYNKAFVYNNLINGEKNPTYFINVSEQFMADPLVIVTPDTRPKYGKDVFDRLHNKMMGDKEIEIGFSTPNFSSYALINQKNISGQQMTSEKYDLFAWTLSIPFISEQTPVDNKGYAYSDDPADNFATGNDVNNWVYNGGPKMYYYYGPFAYNFVLTGTSNNINYNDYCWIGISTGGTATAPTYAKVRVPIASPYKLMSNYEKDNLVDHIRNYPFANWSSELGAEAQALFMTYYNSGKLNNTHMPTDFSLTFGDNEDFVHNNLYTYFHKQKYELYRNSYLLTADMRMNSIDWKEMQNNRPLLYNNEIYQLVSIKNYDPVSRQAEVTMIKK